MAKSLSNKLPPMTEAEFLNQVIGFAKLFGWRVVHFRPAKTEHGWRTPVQADGKGFLDLVLVRERIVFVELKSESGKPTEEQKLWMKWLQKAGQEVYLWKPSNWMDIEECLK